MPEDNYRIVKIFYIILFALTALGAVAGAFYYVNQNGGASDIKSYLDNFINGVNGGVNHAGIAVSEIKSGLVLAAVFAACSFAKPGAAVVGAACLRRGFINGFTNAAFIAGYGKRA